jgi:lysophospholipase L1-like esterase
MNKVILALGLGILLLLTAMLAAQDRTIRVACIGNSITIGSGGATAYPQQLGQRLGSHYNVRNFGVSGTTMLRHGDFPYWNEAAFLQAQDFDPHIIIISLGTNDSKPQNRIYLNEYFSDYMDFIKTFRQNGRDPQIYVCNPPPVFVVHDINATVIRDQICPLVDSVRAAANAFGINWQKALLSHGDLFPDGIHPDAVGYAMMADTAAAAIRNSPSGFIRLFTTSPGAVELGENKTLYWEATAGSRVTLDGAPAGEIDSVRVAPSRRTTYTLIATGAVADTKRVVVDYIPPGRIKTLTAFPLQLDESSVDTSRISWTTTNGSAVFFQGTAVPQNGAMAVTPNVSTNYRLIAEGGERDTSQITIQVLPAHLINRALVHPLTVSSIARGSSAPAAVDGDTTTSWQAAGKNTEWVAVDLIKMITVHKIIIHWGSEYAKSYFIHGLDANLTAKSLYSQANGDGRTDTIVGLNAQARYIRLFCTKSNGAGYTVKELEVYYAPEQAGVEKPDSQPQNFTLAQNYPNPFNPVTIISYHLARSVRVTLALFDLKGRQVRVLDAGMRDPGRHEISVDATGLSSGLYFYRLTAGHNTMQKRMLLIK